ncbi:OLC1v1013622C1 [Oldenlandia corymbosa var. corymbosa]|uniref:OLC1v1013622C1 n=1 Tax=Oldenlandia corymbosa var. corymbosa TaxID=529605 RepID=A0AAV1E0U5_OLDCO|nr:OLC1v1013622C1 [Oldenlandia corymbosa var. corymbosa]
MLFYYFLLFITSFLLLLVPLPFSQTSVYLHHQSEKTKRPKNTYGPPSYPIIGCLLSFYKNRHRLLQWYTDLLKKSPSKTMVVNRFGAPRTIITANPHNVEYILKSNFENYPKGRPFTALLGDFLGRGIFNVDGELWQVQRKFSSHEFSARSLREFVVETLEEEVGEKLLPLLGIAAKNGKVLDLQEVLRRFAFDSICKVSLGVDPCCLDLSLSDETPPLALAFDRASEFCAKRGVAPVPIVWKIKRALNLGSEKELKESVEIVRCYVNEIIESKKNKLAEKKKLDDKGGKGEGDLLSRLLLAGHDDEMVRDMVISFLMAGRDTTSSALTWFFWLISKNDGVKKNVLAEIDELNYINSELNSSLDYEDLKKMRYTKVCLCESMRLYPPVVWDSKHAEKDDILPDGTMVYKGNRVTYFQYGMGRILEEVWGEDCLEFKPERWFDEKGMIKMVSPYEFPVFQAGPRVCLGKEMAFIQMKYVVASILERFEIELVDSKEPAFVPLLTAFMAGGLKVRVHHRADRKKIVK